MTTPDFTEHRERVRPEWTDGRGALRPAYAVVIFDHAIDRLYDGLDIGDAYRAETSYSTFTLETHTLLEADIPAGEEVLVRSRVMDADAKRMRIVQEMFRPSASVRAALMEQLAVHVDLSIRRSAPFPPERLARIKAAMQATGGSDPPAGAGRPIGLTMQLCNDQE